ncbi:MAG: carbon starvation protein A [Bacteroidaceae bacterium]|nr:carbon starvation protein A [Bacteroidaceae bacterium]
MLSFSLAFIFLILGFVFYSKYVEKVVGADADKMTPAYTQNDGVDFMPMPTWKVFLIQFLNIAGTGPIFGAILGVLYGPASYLWIVLGCVFGGAVHDYMSGMMSVRKNGQGIAEIVGDQLGKVARQFMRVFTLVLMVFVGAVFVTSPAGLLADLVGSTDGSFFGTQTFWSIVIFVYYIMATLLPIDKLIGKIYPLFGAALLIMAVGLLFGIFTQDGNMPEITSAFHNHYPNPKAMSLFPGLFITIACGAVSGFHATQSPMMARCIENEKYGRSVFYGAMITEGLVALVWAAATIKFADSLTVDGNTPYEKLMNALTDNGTHSANPAILVNMICQTWMGKVGAVLAILGVVAAPITSGDTAFRSGRLIAADFMHFKQNKIYKRLILALPLFVVALILMQVDFSVLWQYFGWTNQTLSVFTFWGATIWLARNHKNYYITLVPALWMTAVCTTYIMLAPIGFNLDYTLSWVSGCGVAIGLLVIFRYWRRNK